MSDPLAGDSSEESLNPTLGHRVAQIMWTGTMCEIDLDGGVASSP